MTHAQQQRAENEVVFKQRNDAMKDITKRLTSSLPDTHVTMQFICECSNEKCRQTIEMNISDYERARTNNREFIVKLGHEQLDIEEIVYNDGYAIVEKYEAPPATDGKLNST